MQREVWVQGCPSVCPTQKASGHKQNVNRTGNTPDFASVMHKNNPALCWNTKTDDREKTVVFSPLWKQEQLMCPGFIWTQSWFLNNNGFGTSQTRREQFLMWTMLFISPSSLLVRNLSFKSQQAGFLPHPQKQWKKTHLATKNKPGEEVLN